MLVADPEAAEAAKADAILGCGALLPFPRSGWNEAKQVLELEWPHEEGEPVVRCAGRFLGLAIASGCVDARTSVDALPVIVHVVPGSAAARAGVREGQRIAAIDGEACERIELRDRLKRLWADECRSRWWTARGRTRRT